MKLVVLFSLFCYLCCAQNIYVVDGDTFHINYDFKVRLYCIDAPEINTTEGQKAKQKLKELLKNGNIKYQIISTDRYGRKICKVFADGKDVSYELFLSGHAKVYKKYCKEPKFYKR